MFTFQAAGPVSNKVAIRNPLQPRLAVAEKSRIDLTKITGIDCRRLGRLPVPRQPPQICSHPESSVNNDRRLPAPRISNTRRTLRAIPAWCVSLAVHALLCACLVFGMERPGIPDGAETRQKTLQLSARFTSISTTDKSSPQPVVDFVADHETPPQQPVPLETVESPESRLVDADSPGEAVAAASSPTAVVGDEGPATPLSPPATGNVTPGNPPSMQRPRGTASHFAALLSASSRFADQQASSETLNDETDGDNTDQQFGHPNGASFFHISAQGQHFCYVVDCSSSMEDEHAIAMARTELNASLRRLDASKQFQILFYDSELHPLVDRGREIFFATETNRTLARQFMSSQQPNNRALHKPALLAALRSKPDVIFLLTDGQLPELSARDLHDLKTSNKRRIQINVIEFGKGARLGRNWLEQLAQDHRGMYRYEDITTGQ